MEPLLNEQYLKNEKKNSACNNYNPNYGEQNWLMLEIVRTIVTMREEQLTT